jgi:hypothetical protein
LRFFTTIISGLFPALKASKVDPVENKKGIAMESKVIETIGLMKYFYDPVKFQVIKGIDLHHGDFVP